MTEQFELTTEIDIGGGGADIALDCNRCKREIATFRWDVYLSQINEAAQQHQCS